MIEQGVGRQADDVRPEAESCSRCSISVEPTEASEPRGVQTRVGTVHWNEPIYEREVVKRGGADFVKQGSRTSPSPSASVDLAGLEPGHARSVHAPRCTSSESEAEGDCSPSIPAMFESWTDVT